MKQRLLEMIQVTVWLHTDEFIFAKTAKTGQEIKQQPGTTITTTTE